MEAQTHTENPTYSHIPGTAVSSGSCKVFQTCPRKPLRPARCTVPPKTSRGTTLSLHPVQGVGEAQRRAGSGCRSCCLALLPQESQISWNLQGSQGLSRDLWELGGKSRDEKHLGSPGAEAPPLRLSLKTLAHTTSQPNQTPNQPNPSEAGDGQ